MRDQEHNKQNLAPVDNKIKKIIDNISAPDNPVSATKSKDIEKRDEDLRKKRIENDVAENELELKKGICNWVKWVVTIYLIFIAIIVLALTAGIGQLNDNVIIALLTTTTINILGLPYMIIKSLFPSKKE